MKKTFTLFLLLFVVFATTNAINTLEKRNETTSKSRELIKHLIVQNSSTLLKKSFVSKQKMLDRITYTNGSYKTFSYNEAGLLIDYKNYQYNSMSDKIELQEQQQFEYDENGNETSFINHNLDLFEGFIIVEKREASYYDNNIPQEEVWWEIDLSTSTLKKQGKSVYTIIDENNVKIDDYTWDEEEEEWTLTSKAEINFDDPEHPVLITNYHWDSSSAEFLISEQLEFKYNDQGLESEMIEKYASEETGELSVTLTTTWLYDAEGNMLNETTSGTQQGTQMNIYERIYTYENGLLTIEEYKSAFGGTKTEYSYIDGKLSEKRDYFPDYDENGNDLGFSLQYKDQFSYDATISLELLAYPFSLDTYSYNFNDFCDPSYFQYGALTNTICFSWDYRTETVDESYRGTYHYTDFKAGVQQGTALDNIVQPVFLFGPNPCQASLNIMLPTTQSFVVSVYTISGQLQYSAVLQGNHAINTSTWENGIYLISCTSDQGESYTQKLIKQ